MMDPLSYYIPEFAANGKGYILYSSESPYRLLSYKAGNAQLVGNELGGLRRAQRGTKAREHSFGTPVWIGLLLAMVVTVLMKP